VLADGTGPSAVCVPQAAGTPTAPASVIVFVEGTNGACWTMASLDALGTQWFGGTTPATGKYWVSFRGVLTSSPAAVNLSGAIDLTVRNVAGDL